MITTYDSSSCGNINLRKVLPLIPRKRRSKEPRSRINPLKPTIRLRISVKHNTVRPLLLDTNAVIRVALRRMEVKDPDQASTLKDNDFISLVLQADIRLRRVQPAVFLLGVLHAGVELVEELVAEEIVGCEVKLASCVPEAVVISGAGEVEPFGVAELIAFEVEIAFSSESVGDEADHLVESHSSLDDWCEGCEGGHVGVHFRVAEMHHDGFVSDQTRYVSTDMATGKV